MSKRQKFRLISDRRNLISFLLCCLAVVALAVGIAVNAGRYSSGSLPEDEVYRRLWYSLFCLLSFAALFLFEFLLKFRFPLFLECSLIVFAFFALGGGTVFGLYRIVPVYDKLLHGVAGALFGGVGVCFAASLIPPPPRSRDKRTALIVFFGILFSVAVSALWEIFEFAAATLLPNLVQAQITAADTVWDLGASCIGALVFLLPVMYLAFADHKRLRFLEREQDEE